MSETVPVPYIVDFPEPLVECAYEHKDVVLLHHYARHLRSVITDSAAETFPQRVQEYIDEGEIVREGLAHEGAAVVESAVLRAGSLRAAAKATGLSPTYLSRVRLGALFISPGAFLKLHNYAETEP